MKTWKTDGPETKYLEKLFRDGKLNLNSKPGASQQQYPMFNGFSPAVFRKHFGLAKEKCCNNSSTFGDTTLTDGMTHQEIIEELDGDGSPAEKIAKIESRQQKTITPIEFTQPPIVPCVYTDPTTKQDKCFVALMLFNGVKGLNVDIMTRENGTEQTLMVTYNWPSSMYDVKSMFKNDKDGKMMAMDTDPKVVAFEKALTQFRDNIEDAPVATIAVQLPVEVDPDPRTWTKGFNKKNDGGVVVFLEFECIRKDYVIAKNEKFLQIE